MARRSRGSFPVRGAARRKTAWDVGPGGQTVTTYATSGVTLLGFGAAAVVDGLTLIRLRGDIEIILMGASGISNGYAGAMGIGIVTAEAFAAGATAMPDPVADLEWDGWLWHQFIQVHSDIIKSTTLNIPNQHYSVDSKAMRKLRLGDTIFMSSEFIESGTATMDIWFNSRLLVKLP